MKLSLIMVLVACLSTGACKRSPQDKAARFLRNGRELMVRKEYSRASLEFRNAVQLLPKDAEAQYELGLAYLADGIVNAGAAAVFRATQLDPKLDAARVKLAELMVRSGDLGLAKQGQKQMQDLLAATPRNTEALNVLALAELQLGDSESAESHLQEALRALPNNLSSTVTLARIYLSRQDTKHAEQVLKQAAAAAPQSAAAAVTLGWFYILTGNWTEAESAFRKVLGLTPNDARTMVSLAAVELRLGKKEEAEQIYRTVSASADERYKHAYAAYIFEDGRREAGIQEFEKLANSAPHDRAARNRLVAAYMLAGRVPEAEKVLTAALKSSPHDVEARLQHSQLLLRSGKDEDAEADLNEAMHFKPDSAEAHYLMAQIYRLRGDRARQNAELTEALRYDPALLPARVALAQLLTLSGSPKAALEALNSGPEKQKQTWILLLERNLANYAAGDKAAFREGVAQALRTARTPDALLQDAVMKLTERDYAGARASIDEALNQSPDNIRALRAKVFSYTAQNQPKEAARFLAGYPAQFNSAAVAQFVGDWFWSQGDHAQARTAWNRAKNIDSRYLPADLALAQADLADEKLGQARATLRQLLSTDPRNFAGRVLLATLETRAGNFGTAIEQYRKALELQPHNAQVLNNLAYILADKDNKPDEALIYAQESLEGAPENADAAGTLGWILYRKGIYEGARQQLLRATTEDKNSAQRNAVTRKYHLAMTYLKLGDKRRGMEMLGEALRQNPNLPEADMARSLIR
jgi:putative PEP-CTERM system TPR-repeat lipoprotein